MLKVLKESEIGTGLLLEFDAGYISPDLNNHILNENHKIAENEPIFVNCVLQKWGVPNRNGRIYPQDVLVSEVNKYYDIIKNSSSTGEADHPETSLISLHNISHMIVDMWWGKGDEENILYGKLKLIVSQGFLKYGICSVIGDKILLYLQQGIKIGISSRGVGSLKIVSGKKMVQNDFELVGFDLVSSPSTYGAYLQFNEKNDEINESFGMKKTMIDEKITKITIIDNAFNNFLS